MAKRARVLRDPYLGPGLLMVEGRQYPFYIWKSEVLAKPGLAVDVDFDPYGNIQAVTPAAQQDVVDAKTQVCGNITLANLARRGGELLAGFGAPKLAAVTLLVFSCFVLTAVAVQLPLLGSEPLTFWQTLALLNAADSKQFFVGQATYGAGIYGLLAAAAAASPLLAAVVKNRRAHLAGLVPLIFLGVVAYTIHSKVHSSLGMSPGTYESTQSQMPGGTVNEISLGLGSYILLSGALYFAVSSAREFLNRREIRKKQFAGTQQDAA